MDLGIAELRFELVDWRLWTDGNRVVHFQELISRVEVLLSESDVEETVSDLQIVINMLKNTIFN